MASVNQSSIVSKCTRILDLMAAARRPLSFSQIVQRSGFVKSSTHRILSILVGEGLAEYHEQSKAYRLGPKLVTWARSAWRRTDIQQIASLELETLCEQTGMNVALSIQDNDSVLYLRTIDNLPVRYAAHMGEHAPLHCTAVGKVFLAFMPERQRTILVQRLRLERFTEFTIQDPQLLLKELGQVRQQGYATCFQEEFLQVLGIAVPVRNVQGEVFAGVSLWALTEKFSREEMLAQVPAMLHLSERLSSQLGHEAIA